MEYFFEISGKDEIVYNPVPQQKNTNNFSTITGKVYDENFNLVENATVKLYKKDKTPFLHHISKSDGVYIFNNLKSGTYFLTVVHSLYNISEFIEITVNKNQVNEKNLIVKNTNKKVFSSIGGFVFDNKTIVPNCTVVLSSGRKSTKVRTDEYGQYIFFEINENYYKLYAERNGKKSNVITFVLQSSKTLNFNLYF